MRPLLIRNSLFFSVMGILLIGLVIASVGLDYWDELELAAIPNQPMEAPKGKVFIVIKIPARLLELHNDGKIYKQYRIAVGKSDTPSPVGEWIVAWKSYRDGVFGTRYLALNVPWSGFIWPSRTGQATYHQFLSYFHVSLLS